MPRPVIFQTSLAQIFTPAERPEDANQDAVAWSASITVVGGDMIAQRTSTKLCERYAVAGGDGTGAAVGFAIYPFMTGADGKPIIGADTAVPSYLLGGGHHTAPIWQRGTFDLAEIRIGGVAPATFAQVATAFGASRVVQEPNGFVRVT